MKIQKYQNLTGQIREMPQVAVDALGTISRNLSLQDYLGIPDIIRSDQVTVLLLGAEESIVSPSCG